MALVLMRGIFFGGRGEVKVFWGAVFPKNPEFMGFKGWCYHFFGKLDFGGEKNKVQVGYKWVRDCNHHL